MIAFPLCTKVTKPCWFYIDKQFFISEWGNATRIERDVMIDCMCLTKVHLKSCDLISILCKLHCLMTEMAIPLFHHRTKAALSVWLTDAQGLNFHSCVHNKRATDSCACRSSCSYDLSSSTAFDYVFNYVVSLTVLLKGSFQIFRTKPSKYFDVLWFIDFFSTRPCMLVLKRKVSNQVYSQGAGIYL